jgi:drug/metabolite transporter (DMT)-like permease
MLAWEATARLVNGAGSVAMEEAAVGKTMTRPDASSSCENRMADTPNAFGATVRRSFRKGIKTMVARWKNSWRPKVGWGVPVAWLTLCVVWSSTWLVIKIGLRDLPPISYAGIRFVVAVIVLLAVSAGRVRVLPKRASDYIVLAFTGVLMFAVTYGLLFWGELHVSSGLAAVLQATIPIFGMVFAHLMLPNEPLRLQKLSGAVVALGGVAIICQRLLGFDGWMAFWGGLGIVVGAGSAAFSNVLLKARGLQLAPAMIAAWQMIFGAAALLTVGSIIEGNPLYFHWSALSIFCLLYLAVIGSALAFLLLYWLLPRMTVANLQAISLVTPPGAVALGWAIGGEKFSLWSFVGACFVLTGVWMIFRKTKVTK